MNAVGIGVIELLLVLGLGGGFMGLPLGIPPAPEDPMMANVAPQECLFYTTWAGMAEPRADSSNQTEQLLAESEVQHLFAELQRRLTIAARQAAEGEGAQATTMADDAIRWGRRLLTSPTAVFLSSVTMTDEGPDIRGGVIVRVGEEDGAELTAVLEVYRQMLPPELVATVEIDDVSWHRITPPEPEVPQITLGVKDGYFLVGVGEGSIERIIARMQTDPPEWLTDLRGQLPVDRTATLTYINVRGILDTALPLIDEPQVPAVLQATGLSGVKSVASVTGLDGEGFVSRTLVGLDGEPRGLLAFAAADPLTPADLEPIPADATVAMAARLDAAELFEMFLSVVGEIEPRGQEEILRGLSDIREEIGIDVRGAVLGSLGDTWCVYNSPGEGGLVVTGLTAVVEVKDRVRLAAAHQRALALIKAELGQDERGRGPRIEQFEFAGQQVYFLNVRGEEFPLAPAWCLTDNELVVALFPQNIKAYLSRGEDFESLAEVPAVAGVLGPADGPIMLSYADTRSLFELVYPVIPMVAQVAFGELAREGIDLDVSIVPSAAAIGRHLHPTTSVVRRSEGGIELISRQTIPTGNVGATVPMGVAVLLPAVQSARAAAERTASMNNLKQIAVAMHNHDNAFKEFPAAYIADEDGEPLLSWRVKILPFIEQEALYRQFHRDEPWDSEHNKALIPAMPSTYAAPGSTAGPGMTNYLTVRGENTVFPGAARLGMASIPDGMSYTIMAVEVSDPQAVIWTKPDDFEYDEEDPIAGLLGLRPGGFNAAFCDGAVNFIPEGIDPETLRRLFLRNDGQRVNRAEF